MSAHVPGARRTAACLLILAAATLAAGRVIAQELVRSEDAVVALFSLQAQLDVDVAVMRRLEQRLEESLRDRAEARERVDKLYDELDDLFARYRAAIRRRQSRQGGGSREAESGETIERLEEQIEARQRAVIAAERTEIVVREQGHRLRDEIRDHRERMDLLSARIDSLHASLPAPRDAVTGIWDITFLPSGDKGVFALFQSGTLVTGQYSLDGPFHGSLDGTLIDRRLLLHRIDARLGRSMDLTASLSQDGQALRGTWENYDLANGQARTGSWAGRRRQPRANPEEDGGGPEEPEESPP